MLNILGLALFSVILTASNSFGLNRPDPTLAPPLQSVCSEGGSADAEGVLDVWPCAE